MTMINTPNIFYEYRTGHGQLNIILVVAWNTFIITMKTIREFIKRNIHWFIVIKWQVRISATFLFRFKRCLVAWMYPSPPLQLANTRLMFKWRINVSPVLHSGVYHVTMKLHLFTSCIAKKVRRSEEHRGVIIYRLRLKDFTCISPENGYPLGVFSILSLCIPHCAKCMLCW